MSSLHLALSRRSHSSPIRFPLSSFSSSSTPSHAIAVDVHRLAILPDAASEKPRVVVLGIGWAACRLMKVVDTSLYDIVCVFPRNHMVFTPLLDSTCVGTLEFRSVFELIGRIQSAISTTSGSYFFLASCIGVDPVAHMVSVVRSGNASSGASTQRARSGGGGERALAKTRRHHHLGLLRS